MKQFEVHYKGFLVINAESLEQANEIISDRGEIHSTGFIETTKFVDIQNQTSHEVIGHCELTGLAIFEGDSYDYDNEGVMWLKRKEVE